MKYAKLVFKNILRNKLRTLLTLSSLVVSLFLIVTLGTIVTEFDRNVDESNPLRLMSRHAVSLGFVMPMAHVERIRGVPGVKNAMPFNWFGGIYKDERNFFANFAVDATRMRDIMTELKMPDEQWQAFINDKQGAIVGQKLVTLYGFTPGQRITLKSPIYNQSVEFIIRGVCTGGDEKTLFFHHDYINELMPDWAKDQVSMVSIMANSADDVPRIAQAVDSVFANSDAPTKTETEKEFALSFQTMMGGVKTFMYAIMAAITFSGFAHHGKYHGDDRSRTHKGSRHFESHRFPTTHDRVLVSGRSFDCRLRRRCDRNWRSPVDLSFGTSGNLHPVFLPVHTNRADFTRSLYTFCAGRSDQRRLFSISGIRVNNRRSTAEH